MKIKNCCICGKDDSAYKCPMCREPYCSAVCCKKHKIQPCEPPKLFEEAKKHQSVNEWKYKFPTEDTVPIEKLQQLCYSKELKQCLQNPHLRDTMKTILDNPNSTEAIASAMRIPIFVEMADACLKIVEPQDEAKPY